MAPRFRGEAGSAQITPIANSSESPGRNGHTTRPVSANTMQKMTTYRFRVPTYCMNPVSDSGLRWRIVQANFLMNSMPETLQLESPHATRAVHHADAPRGNIPASDYRS